MMKDIFAITEIDRRVSNLIQIATITEADYVSAKVKVKVGDIVTHWLPWITLRAHKTKTWCAPEVGEQVLLLAPSGELMQAVVLPSIYSNNNSAPDDDVDVHKTIYRDGTILQYDSANHVLSSNVNNAGRIELVVGESKITVTSDAIRLQSGGSAIVITADGIGTKGKKIDVS